MPPEVLPPAAFSHTPIANRYGLLTGRCYAERCLRHHRDLVRSMLKEVMLGSGGIMLAAAIFASSMTPGTIPAPAAPQQPAQVVAAPSPAPVAAAPRPAAVFPEDTGDIDFGAPMIEAVPVETGLADPAVNTAAPDSAEAAGGRQFYARPGSPNPIPR